MSGDVPLDAFAGYLSSLLAITTDNALSSIGSELNGLDGEDNKVG